tara:strand:- start:164 stop:697 length:534 start_codon:yes stop_codon:yes gene_type:complete
MEGVAVMNETIENSDATLHLLKDKWTLWAHLPHDTDWTVESYKKIHTVDSVEGIIVLCETLPEKMVKNCMLFFMREGIQPTWEDARNSQGGCFSYKVNNKVVYNTWKSLAYSLLGESLSSNSNLMQAINGITISPKKNFCIIKIWLANCEFQDPKAMINIPGLSSIGCLFKRHLPEY